MFNSIKSSKLSVPKVKRVKVSPVSTITYKFARSVYTNSEMKRTVHDFISLNETEKKIRDVLVNFCDHYNSQPNCKPLELRITGGWVRDKLLGNESNDIDIAINHLTGEEFADTLHKYLQEYHPELSLRAIHTIKKNPEKSKHLETCTTKLFGHDIDFVNLRSEKYSDDSRVPIIEFGSADEDARRRDATLNALFYNLNLDKIEDFTGRGMEDLKNGVLRTPLPPLQTFLDDPLRVLRLIRFACRFNFVIDPETFKSMQNPEIKSALATKISRERVGIEIEKTLMSGNAEYGLQLLNYTGLFKSIFNFGELDGVIHKINPENLLQQFDSRYQLLENQVNCATIVYPKFQQILKESKTPMSEIFSEAFVESESRKLFWLAVILAPFKSLSVMTHPKKDTKIHVPEILLREGLRYSKKDIDVVSSLTYYYETSQDQLQHFLINKTDVKRSELGLYLRQFKTYLKLNILFCCFNDIVHEVLPSKFPMEQPVPKEIGSIEPQREFDAVVLQTISKYDGLLKLIKSQDLENVYSLKPIVDGKVLSKELGIKPGPWMGKVTPEVLIWQLDNPTKSAEECLSYIKSIIDNYTK
jgi:tRNA nucleotidyltransferase (CCA-adding enzyme)